MTTARDGFVLLLLLATASAALRRPNASPPLRGVFGSRPSFNITDFGAVGDGVTLNTRAIVAAIAAAAAVPAGGDVVVPSGTFVTGAFNISSNVHLHLAELDSMLYASDNATDYVCLPSVTSDTGPCDYPLVAAVDATNVAIHGPGAINGGANDPPGHLVASYNATSQFITPVLWDLPQCEGYSCRPKLLVIKGCTGVELKNAQFLNSPLWTITLVLSRDVLVEDCQVHGDRRWPNNDGIDPVDTSDLVIRRVNISTGDDSICVINHTPVGMHNITVEDSVVASSSGALKVSAYDAVASGNVTDVTFRRITICDTNRGMGVMPRWGSGTLANIRYEDIVVETHYFSSPWWGSAEPIYLTSMGESLTNLWTGRVVNVTFANITGRAEAGVIVYGQEGTPASIVGLVFENIELAIGQWYSNLSRPVHDYRPAPMPDIFYAPTDGFFFGGAMDDVSLTQVEVSFTGPAQPFWGVCLNSSVPITQVDVECENPPLLK